MEGFLERINFVELDHINSSNYTYTFPSNEPLILGENAEIGLKSYAYWYTNPNLSSKYQNNIVKVKYNNIWKTITIPDGMWEIDKLGDFINQVTVTGNSVQPIGEPNLPQVIKLDVDKSTFHCLVQLKSGVELDLSEGKLYELLGLEPKIYTSSERGQNYINITRNLDKIYIRCNLVDRLYQYNLRDVLYSILPIALPGECIMAEVDHPIEYFKCKNRVIREINIRITNENNEEIILKDIVKIKIAFKHHVKIK